MQDALLMACNIFQHTHTHPWSFTKCKRGRKLKGLNHHQILSIRTHLGLGGAEVPAALLATAHGCDINGSLLLEGKAAQ
jgi:hypothetical protein